ncbi:uncharacterized protein SCHCODRAFT_02555191 [Schizophyllum commune H4-8]|nr:uncharacterized protein SCHCODRAFT_02555191 [Schizophyllum commune H4-8]KAI5886342.1 hypothetical protein SCHCODRAFT_02555191 [Schizophyllum commune H4-8]
MSLRHPIRRLSLEERLDRSASVANLAMLRSHCEPSHIQIQTIKWLTFLLEAYLRILPPDDIPTRTRILHQLDINRSVLAPIRRLPVELLSYIFSLIVKGSPLRTVNISATLARICTSWREVARGHASLWTTVVVDTPNGFDEYRELFLPLTKDMLLDLRCDNREILGELWDRMAPYASRWRRITLEARLSMLSDLQVVYMERLERLVVFAYDAPVSTELSVLDFVVAPRLRHIALTLDELQSERQLHVPVARKLTSLVIEAMSPFPITHTLPLLHACADTLQSLTIKVRHPLEGSEGSYPTSTSDTFVMKALTFLSLIDPACALLNHISAPLVRELILGNVPAYGTQSLLGYLTRSRASRSLRILRIYSVEERDIYAWIPCLQLMDSLIAMHFDDLLSNREFLNIMVRRADKPVLLPSLKALALDRVDEEHGELQGIIDEMCVSRAKPTRFPGCEEAYELLGWIREDEFGIRWR